MLRTPIIWLALILLVPPCETNGQPRRASPEGDAIVTVDYIPSPNLGRIKKIIRDNRGSLWFGTTNGLQKYDGYDVRVLENTTAPESKIGSQNVITGVVNNPDGSLVLATWNGLWSFDPLKETFDPFPGTARFGDGQIEALARDSSGMLWIGTRSGGLYSYDVISHDTKRYSVRDGLSDSAISALFVDRHGMLWIGTRSGGLNTLSPSTSAVSNYCYDPADSATLFPGSVNSIIQDEAHFLWIGTDGGVSRLDPSTGQIQRTHLPRAPEASVSALGNDPLGRLWVGFSERGLYCISNGSVTRITDRGAEHPRLNDGVVDDIYIDPASSRERVVVWVGTRGGGVNKIVWRRNPFRVALRDQGSFKIGRGAVLSFCEDHTGILWVGTWGGGMSGYRFVEGEYVRIATYGSAEQPPYRLPSNDVYATLEDREGNLWIGTDKGLSVLDERRTHIVTYVHSPGDTLSIAGNLILSLKEDSHGIVWICTSSGLSRLVGGKPMRFRNYLHAPIHDRRGVAGYVTDIMEDRSSNLWVTVHGGGLNKFNRENDTFQRFSLPRDTSGYMENWMSQVFEDHRGTLWIWTDGGIVLFDPRSESFSGFDASFLQGGYIFGMTEDNLGHMLFATGIGLLRLTPSTGAVVRYDDAHGFPFTELTSEFHQTTHGSVYVGGLDGFAEFTPDSLNERSAVPTIAITGFAVFGKAQPLPMPEVHLAYNQNYFSFSFAAMDLVNPSLNRFAYRLEGVDPDWYDAGTRHSTSYTNLDPGNYIFRVKGSNSEGVWNNEGASVRIVIAPPYWRTWWFALLSAALLVALTAASYRYRVQKLLEMQKIRLRIARDLHDDVGSNLGAIAFVSRTLKDAPELSDATRSRLATIYNTAVKTSEGMRDIVWLITPERDNIDDLVLQMKDTASSMLGAIEHKFEDRSGGADVSLSLEFRRSVFLAFKEILANIVKHAAATRVEIEVSRENETLNVSIRDNGKGFDESSVRSGNGLASVRNRAKIAGGVCTIVSAAGIGTTVKFNASLLTH